MFNLLDGTEMTFEQAAQLIEQAGQLGEGLFDTFTGLSCALGVIIGLDGQDYLDNQRNIENQAYGITCATFKYENEIRHEKFVDVVFMENDQFHGTPEERAVYMAAWFRKLES